MIMCYYIVVELRGWLPGVSSPLPQWVPGWTQVTKPLGLSSQCLLQSIPVFLSSLSPHPPILFNIWLHLHKVGDSELSPCGEVLGVSSVESVLSLMVIKLEEPGTFGNQKEAKVLRKEPKGVNPPLTLATILT